MNLREAELAGLMRLANAGDETAYARLLKELVPLLRALAARAVARGATGIDAEDIVQETLIAIHLKRNTWIASEPLGPWIRAIARHKLIDHYRRSAVRSQLDVAWSDEIVDTPELSSEFDRIADQDELFVLLAPLPESQRVVILLRYVDGMSVRETAEVLGKSEHAVESLLARGKRTLRAALESAEEQRR